MAPKNNKSDTKGLAYVAATPAFLRNFGQPQPPPGRAGESNSGGRAALPERPNDGRWAGGSDGEEEEDEWDAKFGGGGDEGPQVVVLKEGRHLTAEEVKRERNRAAGKRSQSPPPSRSTSDLPGKTSSTTHTKEAIARPTKPVIPKPNTSKRKLVGAAAGEEEDPDEDGKKSGKGEAGGKKKKKKGKGMLSFNEAEGEE